jgi:winged helix DNA-binding protein
MTGERSHPPVDAPQDHARAQRAVAGRAARIHPPQGLVGATDGNGAHLETLAKASYVAIQRLFVGKKPQTRVKPTPAGRRAFTEHVAYLREILDGGAPP